MQALLSMTSLFRPDSAQVAPQVPRALNPSRITTLCLAEAQAPGTRAR